MSLPVALPTAISMYFVIWWVVLFAVLPFGVRSQEEGGTVVPGTEPGAPQAPQLLKKAFWTTVVSAVLFAALLAFMTYESGGRPG